MWWAELLNNIISILDGGGGATNSYESIATVTVGAGGSSSITFSSIPSTYKHLQIRGIAKANNASALTYGRIQFNGDTGANYFWHDLYGQGASAGVDAIPNASNLFAGLWAGTSYANTFGAVIIDILDYSNTNKNKTIRVLNGTEFNSNDANGQLRFISGAWNNTNAITSINLFEGVYSAALTQYSQFALYGVKG